MSLRPVLICVTVAAFLLACIPIVAADDIAYSTVVYQTTFSSDPKWVTNNPSSDYWDADKGMYHFSIEPSTGNYAYYAGSQYEPLDYERGSFKLEYDVIFERVDASVNEGATFRLGFSGAEMDPLKGPMVLTQFTNAKYGQIMWLHLVTNGNKMTQVNSQSGDTAYNGPTVKYELNTTYHVAVSYNADNALVTMKVTEKRTGKDVWSYYVNVAQELHGMNRIFIGSVGDYGMMGLYATGYIDNVRLTKPAEIEETPVVTQTPVEITTRPTAIPTTVQTIGTVPAGDSGATQTPVSALIPVAAVALAGLCIALFGRRE